MAESRTTLGLGLKAYDGLNNLEGRFVPAEATALRKALAKTTEAVYRDSALVALDAPQDGPRRLAVQGTWAPPVLVHSEGPQGHTQVRRLRGEQ